MSKNQKGSSATSEQKIPQTENVENTTQVENAPVPAPTNEQIRAQLVAAFNDADAKLTAAKTSGNYADIGKLAMNFQKAISAINAHDAKLESEKIAAENEAKRLASFDYVAAALNVSRETIEKLVETDKADANQPLRQALTAIFGGKITVAKEGQTGKSLSGNNSTGERGGKSAEILEYLKTGTATRAEMLQRYPTEGNPDKINGTARTVISNGGWKINEQGFYAQS